MSFSDLLNESETFASAGSWDSARQACELAEQVASDEGERAAVDKWRQRLNELAAESGEPFAAGRKDTSSDDPFSLLQDFMNLGEVMRAGEKSTETVVSTEPDCAAANPKQDNGATVERSNTEDSDRAGAAPQCSGQMIASAPAQGEESIEKKTEVPSQPTAMPINAAAEPPGGGQVAKDEEKGAKRPTALARSEQSTVTTKKDEPTSEPETLKPSTERTFVDPVFNEFIEQQKFGTLDRKTREPDLAQVPTAEDEAPAELRSEAAEGETRSERPRKKKRLSVSIEKVFSLPVLIVVGIIGSFCMVWEPWNWSSSSSAEAATPQGTDQRGDKYPNIEFRQPRETPVTEAEVQSRFNQTQPPPKAEFEPLPEPSKEGQPQAVAETNAVRSSPALTKTSSRRITAPEPEKKPVAPPPAVVQSPVISDDALLPRRRGSRFFTLPDTASKPTASAQPSRSNGTLGIPIGTRIKVALQIGISSAARDKVLAAVLEAVKVGDRIVIPKDALLVGQPSSSSDDRMFIHFSHVVIDGKKTPLEATAVDGDLPGVHAQKRQATIEERQKAEIAKGAVEAAADVALGLAGGAGEVVRHLSDGVVQETQRAQTIDSSVVLVVPAKTKFEAVITE